MPPRKNANKAPKAAKTTQDNEPKKRKRKEKPQLKVPTIVKVKPKPNLNLESTNDCESKPTTKPVKKAGPRRTVITRGIDKNKQSNIVNMKIELANEVARAQLDKSKPVIFDQPVTNVTNTPTKKGRAKKISEKSIKNSTDSEGNFENSQQEIKIKQLSTQSQVNKAVKTIGNLENSEQEIEIKLLPTKPKPKKSVKKTSENLENSQQEMEIKLLPIKPQPKKLVKKTIENLEDSQQEIEIKLLPTKTQPKPVKRTIAASKSKADSTVTRSASKRNIVSNTTEVPTKRKRVSKAAKGKEVDDASITSPSILDESKLNLNCTETVISKETVTDNRTVRARKTSVGSASTNLSWTKDISSSSTTTFVTICSNDFVRIDNKLPILKLVNIDVKQERDRDVIEGDISPSGSELHDDHSETGSSTSFEKECSGNILNLSTSSLSNVNSNIPTIEKNVSKLCKALDKLSSKLKHFDLEIINWIGCNVDETYNKDFNFQDNVFKILKEESDVISHCRKLKKLHIVDYKEDAIIDVQNDKIQQLQEVVDIRSESDNDNCYDDDIFINNENQFMILNNGYLGHDSESPLTVLNNEEENIGHCASNTPCDVNDDDDALSLYAESITGIDSSRINSSVASVTHLEEYIPQPVSLAPKSDNLVYHPSKIINFDNTLNNETINNEISKSTCEKQNADSSTSINQETEHTNVQQIQVTANFNTPITPNVSEDLIQKTTTFAPSMNILQGNVASLMSSRYKAIPGIKSNIFKGVCFFNLISNCKKNRCLFPHQNIDCLSVKNKLTRLNEDIFIQEYMLMRNYPSLRRKFGLCFVEECVRRELLRILVEMAIDFIAKSSPNSQDAILKVSVTETTLLYLNNVDLCDCKDLLKLNFSNRILLCDIFMETIADSQNFSRFKPVFIKLTNFISDMGRTFSLNVASKILERVCILPYEEALSRALLAIIKSTDSKIFEDSMLGHFQKQLLSSDKDVYDELASLRKQATLNQRVIRSPSIASPRLILDISQASLQQAEESYTSPDTTHLDNANKIDEPIIIKTINFNRRLFNEQMSPNSSSFSSDSEDRPKGNAKHLKWRNSGFPRHNTMGPNTSQLGPHQENAHQSYRRVAYKPLDFSKFPRRSGPDFF